MANVTVSTSNANRPAPKWWRKLENGLLMVLIPAIVAILMGWGFADEAFANKLILLINTGIVALVKFIGMMLANGDDYLSNYQQEYNGSREAIWYEKADNFPPKGDETKLYYDASTDEYYYWTGTMYARWVGPRPPKPPKPPL